jgi:lysyl-tRNA synthetase, class II
MANRSRPVLTAAAQVLALAVAIIVVTTLTTGWLYWLRAPVASWPGPMVHDVLPLDELADHDRVPLVVVIVAFGLAGAVLGLLARVLGIGRVPAGLGLALGVGGWLFLADAVCLFIVRQDPLPQEFRATIGLQPIYLAAALAGAGGALLGRSRTGNRPAGTASVLTWLVAVGGLVDLTSALFPHHGMVLGAVEQFEPGLVTPAAHVLVVPVGALLLISARGLARRSSRAWQLSVVLLGLSAVLHLLRGPDYAGAIVTALIAVVLLARRQDFPFSGDPGAQPSAILRLAGMLVLAVVFGLAAEFAYQLAAGPLISVNAAFSDTLRAVVGLHPVNARYLAPGFARWFPPSVLSIAVIGVIWAADVWLRPWRERIFPDAGRRERATAIVRRWGGDTLAPFALRADKDWFIRGETLIAFRVVRGIALVSGDPIGPPEELGQALDAFLSHARARGWHVAVLGASDRLLPAYRERGLHPSYHGSEAVIEVPSFSLEGRRMRTARQAVHRLQRHGYRAETVTAGDITPALRTELAATDQAWLRGRVRKGFTMELDSMFRLGGDDAVFVIGRDGDGVLAGCLHIAVCAPSKSLSLSCLPRLMATPNGFSAWLIVNAVEWAGWHGYEHLSLNFAPFAELLSGETHLTSAQRLERGALLRLKRALALQLDNLVRFDRQFCPRWRSRYVVVEHRTDLPRVALVAMAAEGYLPCAALVRGADWLPASCEPDAEPMSTDAGLVSSAAASSATRGESVPAAGQVTVSAPESERAAEAARVDSRSATPQREKGLPSARSAGSAAAAPPASG